MKEIKGGGNDGTVTHYLFSNVEHSNKQLDHEISHGKYHYTCKSLLTCFPMPSQ